MINICDLNESISGKIESWCVENKIQVIGKIAFDPEIVTAMINCQSITEWRPESETSKEILHIWKQMSNDKNDQHNNDKTRSNR